MNQPHSRHSRLANLVVLLLHFLVVAAAPVVDGGARVPAGLGVGVHIEAPSDSPCYPVHDDFHCQICHVLGHNLLAAPRMASAFVPFSAVTLAPPTVAYSHSRGALTSNLGPRAPPLV